MSSKIKKQKRDGLVQLDKTRVKIISDYVQKNNPKSKKTAYVIENGTSIEKYCLDFSGFFCSYSLNTL